MDFKDSFKQLSDKVLKLRAQILTEEATKNALIMPFIQMLGYDVFDPIEVIPEMDCDLIKKKGEKIDYAIMKDGEPIMLIECKHWKQDLTLHDNQLQKYFVASKAKFGVLTNGVKYRFYTDLVKVNIMDEVPFLEIDLENYRDTQIEEVKKFHKSYFDIDTILSSASELKYMSELKTILQQEFNCPSPEFTKLFTKQVYDGMITPKVLEQFTEIVKRSISNYINDVISERLNIAMQNTEPQRNNESNSENNACDTTVESQKITTTEEELEGFYIIKSILRSTITSERITCRDAQTYFAILIDDNNRKTACRLYLNSATNKQLLIFDDSKKEIRYKINSLDELYNYSEQLIDTVKKFI